MSDIHHIRGLIAGAVLTGLTATAPALAKGDLSGPTSDSHQCIPAASSGLSHAYGPPTAASAGDALCLGVGLAGGHVGNVFDLDGRLTSVGANDGLPSLDALSEWFALDLLENGPRVGDESFEFWSDLTSLDAADFEMPGLETLDGLEAEAEPDAEIDQDSAGLKPAAASEG